MTVLLPRSPRLNERVHDRAQSSEDRVAVLAVWAALIAALYREIVGHSTIVFIGSYNLTTAEPVFLLACCAVIMRAQARRLAIGPLSLVLIGFVGLLGFGLLRGLVSDPFAAIVSLRSTGALAAFLVLALYLSDSPKFSHLIRSTTVRVAFCLCGLVLLRLIFGADLFMQVKGLRVDQVNDGGRPLAAAGALVIATASIFIASRVVSPRPEEGRREGLKLCVLLTALLATGQGTATICGLLGVALVFGLERGRGRLLRAVCVIVPAILLAILLLLAPSVLSPESWNGLLPDGVIENLTRRQLNVGTRQIIWRGVLDSFQGWGAFDKLFGLKAGQAPHIIIISRAWGRVVWEASTHSMYFGTLVSTGVLGLALYVLFLFGGAVSSFASILRGTGQYSGGALSFAIFVTYAVYGYSYDLRHEQGVILALAFMLRVSDAKHKLALPRAVLAA